MPEIFRKDGFKFIIYYNDHDPRHVHVEKGEARAKIMFQDQIDVMSFYGFKSKELRRILELTVENYELLNQKWDEIVDKR
jgi:hypothetical protein